MGRKTLSWVLMRHNLGRVTTEMTHLAAINILFENNKF